MIKTKWGIFFLSIHILGTSNPLHAAESDHEQHESHLHGEAQFFVAIEGDTLEIEFDSPAMNIVGFEHKPRTKAQAQSVESAIETLKQPGLLFTLPPTAQCELTAVKVESPLVERRKHDHEEEEHSGHDSDEEGHSDFTAHYRYQCADISYLKRIEFELFKQFPGTEALEVQSISKQGQQKTDLTPGNSILEL